MTGILIWQVVARFVPMGTYIIPISMAVTLAVYSYYGIYKKKLFQALKYNWGLTAFVIAGGLWCIMSVLGLAGWFNLTREFGVNLSFLPRQAYYFAYLPLIAFAPFFKADRSIEFLKKYNNEIILVLYILFCIRSRMIYILPINDFFTLAFLSLLGNRKRKLDWVPFVIFLLMPIYEHGGSTIILLKIIYAGLFIFKNAKWVLKLATLTIPLILIASFVMPQFSQVVEKIPDANAKWRLAYWEDCTSAIIDSYGMGIGYGTTYASTLFTTPQSEKHYDVTSNMWGERPFSENEEYTKEERPFVTSTHNSFVAVGLRMGILGIALFCGALLAIWKKIYKYKGKEQAALAFLFCGTMLIISLNVGLESPGYFQTFITAMCIISALTSQEEQISKGETDEMLGSYSVV